MRLTSRLLARAARPNSSTRFNTTSGPCIKGSCLRIKHHPGSSARRSDRHKDQNLLGPESGQGIAGRIGFRSPFCVHQVSSCRTPRVSCWHCRLYRNAPLAVALRADEVRIPWMSTVAQGYRLLAGPGLGFQHDGAGVVPVECYSLEIQQPPKENSERRDGCFANRR